MSDRLIIDASVAVAWVKPSQATPFSEAAFRAAEEGIHLDAPSIWPLEVANSLLVLERRAKMTQAEREEALRSIAEFDVNLDYEGAELAFGTVFDLARQHKLSAYDAAYLELALRLKTPLACKDGALRTAAGIAGVELWA